MTIINGVVYHYEHSGREECVKCAYYDNCELKEPGNIPGWAVLLYICFIAIILCIVL